MQIFKTSVLKLLTLIGMGLALAPAAQASAALAPWPMDESNYARPITERYQSERVDGTVLYAQSKQGSLRSRGEVIAEVKRRYNAEVLRISLAKSGDVYNVRILMPNGKVRNIRVSARR